MNGLYPDFGTNDMILEIFWPKNLDKQMAFLTQNTVAL
jgi:hypothetical protein